MDSVYFIFVIIQILVMNESFKVIVLIIVNLIKVDDDESWYGCRNGMYIVY